MFKVGDTVYRIKYKIILPCDDDYYAYYLPIKVEEDEIVKVYTEGVWVGSVILKVDGVNSIKDLYQTREEAQKAFINDRESYRNNKDIIRAYKLLKELFE